VGVRRDDLAGVDDGAEEDALGAAALVLCGLFAAGVTFTVIETDWREASRGSFDTTAEAIGQALLSPFVLPFEIASVLLVVAMVGAIVLVREDS
jgi:NAD(P)H-quinone oxidoreductase subunit 6